VAPPTAEELEACPFCEGREGRTPSETLALGRPAGAEPDTPGWTVRVVPNLYPALERQEVVVHTPSHNRTLADLGPDELRVVARAWRERAAAARAGGFPYVQALLNEGQDAGASLPHSHSQLVWLRASPPAVVAEDAGSENGCAVCALVAQERREGTRLVVERDGLALVAAYAGRLPYELLLAPADHPGESAFESEALPAALALLGEAIRRLHTLEGPVPLNAWLHDGGHWHVELVPRMSVLAGLELGAGLFVNTLAPETAAERLREAN